MLNIPADSGAPFTPIRDDVSERSVSATPNATSPDATRRLTSPFELATRAWGQPGTRSGGGVPGAAVLQGAKWGANDGRHQAMPSHC